MSIKINTLLLALFLVFGTVMVSLAKPPNAEPHTSGNTGNPTSLSSTNESPVPVLDGLDILLLLAGGYGVSRYFQVRKQVETHFM
jgi:hypothetical protein